ncbi:hypothetical protein HYH03_012661 [Edaphochlamys debaryana]|uniref:Uncharacterized protein n=1 Tax=Edaphochlamys debaryana TaxID=47281 RepID=A0A835XRQ1_9CHLO|nr:hypothetical protein HYH03_012661 [Edaphochlamys debaryana]|eukprot:KAG2488866.1 hypothetical protein HYH03_012661 [Edaphochlamys debaryana]
MPLHLTGPHQHQREGTTPPANTHHVTRPCITPSRHHYLRRLRAANVEAELRRVRDDVAHLEQRLAGLTKANTDQATEISSGLLEQLRAATAKYDTLRQQLVLWQLHVQSVNNSGAALAQALNNALSSS